LQIPRTVHPPTIGTSTPLLIAQHLNGAAYANVGGLEITSTGVNIIILGAGDAAAVGKAGASVRTPLYSYGDAGGFAMGTWVPCQFEIDFSTNQIKGRATGTDGITVKTATVSGLALQGATTKNNFRLCIRNNGTGNTSTIHYDNVVFQGFADSSAGAENWGLYD
jgi:hypothetical protein